MAACPKARLVPANRAIAAADAVSRFRIELLLCGTAPADNRAQMVTFRDTKEFSSSDRADPVQAFKYAHDGFELLQNHEKGRSRRSNSRRCGHGTIFYISS